MYVPLHVHSNFSFLEGAAHPEELVETAHELGLPALALTDRDGVYGVVRAHVRASELGLPLVLGAEVTIEGGRTLLLLAQDRPGYGRLCQLLSKGRLRSPKGSSVVTWAEVLESAAGLVALASPRPGGVVAAAATTPARTGAGGDDGPPRALAELQDAFGDRLYVLAHRHREPEDEEHVARGRAWARALGVPLVAATEVLYHRRERKPLQDVLTCVRHGCTLVEAGRRLTANAEHALLAPEEFAGLWSDLPDAVAASREVAQRCGFSLAELRYRYPSEDLPEGTTTRARLRELTFAGARERYPRGVPAAVRAQLERELGIIAQLDYEGYFLTMWEVVRFCRHNGILCQGRGSAANSAVCYCLGITAIDPVRMDLLFERFVSLERAEPPDIDLDIQNDRREEVIQWVYARYGRRYAAMVAVVIRYRGRSAVRDVGKTLGLEPPQLDRIAGLLSFWETKVAPETVRQAGFDPDDPLLGRLLSLVAEIQQFPRHLSIHPGGFMLGHEPVDTIVPVENGTMADRTVIQWDKDDIEALGIFKVDLLGLGMLSQVDGCLRLLRDTRGLHLTLASIPGDDAPTFEMCQRADTVGVFQIESRAQMAMLPRLKPRTFYDLVVQVAIIRPGPITGGMVHPYLRRRNGEEPVEYPHECLRPVLEKTLGVPLFQEQVMKLAVVAAGYTPGEADRLRRDMAAWRLKGHLDRHRDRLVAGMRERGIAEEFAERVFQQILGFGEYGFPESHAASFALIAYASAYLKCHFPAEFACALLNAQPMGFYSPSTIIQDARRHGVRMLPVDVNASAWDATMERGAVRLGLRSVKGLGPALGQTVLRAREQGGSFTAVPDLVARTGADRGAVEALAAAGAFEGLAAGRRQALWDARLPAKPREGALDLPPASEPRPALAPLAPVEEVFWDYRATDLSPRGHPMEAVRGALARRGIPTAAELNALPHGRRVRYAGLVICRQRPATAKGVTFLSVEDESGIVNVVVWENLFQRQTVLAKTASFLGVTGRVESQGGVIHLIADELWVPELARDDGGAQAPHPIGTRNFH